MNSLKNQIKSKYLLQKRPILLGFFSVFGIGNNPLKGTAAAYVSRDIMSGLTSDMQAISGDFRRVFNREKGFSEKTNVE